MPYIIKSKRNELDPIIEKLRQALVGLALDDENDVLEGNLNYIFTKLLMLSYGDKNSTRYSQINEAIGILECVKLELYRKVASTYEDKKEEENGEIDITINPIVTNVVTVEKE